MRHGSCAFDTEHGPAVTLPLQYKCTKIIVYQCYIYFWKVYSMYTRTRSIKWFACQLENDAKKVFKEHINSEYYFQSYKNGGGLSRIETV